MIARPARASRASRPPRLALGLAVAFGLAVAPPFAAADEGGAAGRRLTIAEALDLGLTRSPDLAISARSVDAARKHLSADRALRGPSLAVEANLAWWDTEQTIEFGSFPPIVAREQLTTSTTVRMLQPLSGQIQIGNLVDADRAAVRGAEREQAAARQQLAAGIAQVYLGVLLSRSQTEIAGARVSAVDAQLARARVLAQGGVLKRVDVLRLEAALAAGRREVIAAEAAAASASEQLALLLGLEPGSRVDVVDDLAEQPRSPPIDGAAAETGALGRDELAVARARADQASAGKRVARGSLAPTLFGIGSYTHTTGAGPLQPADSWFVGLGLEWNVWDWGRNFRLYQEAGVRADQTRRLAERQRDRARVEARKQVRDAGAAYQALAVARAGLAAAEEAYRIQGVRFAEGDTTTTDLLQAEAEQAQARLALVAARHAYFVQLAALAQATGQRPDAVFAQVR